MVKNAYIHIPFCKNKCKYCSFTSFTNTEKSLGYLYSLLKEIDINYNSESLQTLYFGGGTPSLISPEYLEKILKKFLLDKDAEITLELNPDDAKLDYLKKLIDIGINRLSIGTQTFNDEVLQLIGRRHSAQQAIRAVEQAKEAGFKNISVDLIYGLPNANISKDLEIISQLDIQHVSTYGLKIEEGSYFYKNTPDNLPDDDSQADMYLEINSTLEKINFKRYEISNFALNGYESKHNLNYWNNNEYYGFGVSAHGYIDGIRYSNTTSLEEYLNNPTLHKKGHLQTIDEIIEEEIFLGFRKTEGISLKLFQDKFGLDFEKKYNQILKKYIPDYIEKTPYGYKLTLKGVLLSNCILSDFL